MSIDNSNYIERSQPKSLNTDIYTDEDQQSDQLHLNDEQHQQLLTWNATAKKYPAALCLPQLFTQQAARTPNALAVASDTAVLTYKQVDVLSTQLAHTLAKRGVGPNVLVGCCIERSPDMVVGLLGILKAGGAYVPLDPTNPAQRLAFMLNDSQAPVVVTQEKHLSQLPQLKAHIVCIDRDVVPSVEPIDEKSLQPAQIEDLAYVIYTSGSTGQPKGVEITHANLLNLIYWHQDVFSVTPADRATQVSSPAFDATGWEVWPYLTLGASVFFPDQDTRVSPTLFRDWLISNSITITFLPTPLAEHMMMLQWPAATSLRFLLTGADTLHHYPAPDLPFAVINNYGPTEATVVATSGRIYPTDYANTAPTIGRPIANTQIYILDEDMHQVPIGAQGEIYIGGAGLARGYLNRPDLTAAKFLPDPFSATVDARLYKTGDLARYLPDGQIAFLGRVDQQVKLRGYRIELGEIEVALSQHPDVQQAIVNIEGDTAEAAHLKAYIVTQNRTSSTLVPQLQQDLSKHLPDYMLPSAYVLLDTLPLTPNGKVDRAALTALAKVNSTDNEMVVEPETPTEQRVAAIMSSLLDMPEVGLDSNFFMLGGHSLLGTQVIARVADTFGVELPLRTLFNAPTVRQLSLEIERLIVVRLEQMSEEDVRQILKADAAH